MNLHPQCQIQIPHDFAGMMQSADWLELKYTKTKTEFNSANLLYALLKSIFPYAFGVKIYIAYKTFIHWILVLIYSLFRWISTKFWNGVSNRRIIKSWNRLRKEIIWGYSKKPLCSLLTKVKLKLKSAKMFSRIYS